MFSGYRMFWNPDIWRDGRQKILKNDSKETVYILFTPYIKDYIFIYFSNLDVISNYYSLFSILTNILISTLNLIMIIKGPLIF